MLRVHLIVGETCQFFHACQNLTVRKEEGIVFRLHRWEGTGEMTQCYTKYFVCLSKAELPQKGILFRTQFPPLGIFINKKVGFQKN